MEIKEISETYFEEDCEGNYIDEFKLLCPICNSIWWQESNAETHGGDWSPCSHLQFVWHEYGFLTYGDNSLDDFIESYEKICVEEQIPKIEDNDFGYNDWYPINLNLLKRLACDSVSAIYIDDSPRGFSSVAYGIKE